MSTLREGDLVCCINDDGGDLQSIRAGTVYTVVSILVDRDGDEFVSVEGDEPAWLSSRFVPAEPAAVMARCGICGAMGGGSPCDYCKAAASRIVAWHIDRAAPTACVPDDQPQQTYEQRRAEIARRRNPGRPVFPGVDWGCVPSHTVYAVAGDGFYTIAYPAGDWQPDGPDLSGIARAVANLNQHENRLGASRFQP